MTVYDDTSLTEIKKQASLRSHQLLQFLSKYAFAETIFTRIIKVYLRMYLTIK